MTRTQMNRLIKSGATSILLVTALIAGLKMTPKTLAGDSKVAAACNGPSEGARPLFNLEADAQTPFKVKLTWDVCPNQKYDFYEVRWSRSNGAETPVKLDDPKTRTWTLTKVRDEITYAFKVRGCQNAAKEPVCAAWTELKIRTPDWD
jgi:hypothetical protein